MFQENGNAGEAGALVWLQENAVLCPDAFSSSSPPPSSFLRLCFSPPPPFPSTSLTEFPHTDKGENFILLFKIPFSSSEQLLSPVLTTGRNGDAEGLRALSKIPQSMTEDYQLYSLENSMRHKENLRDFKRFEKWWILFVDNVARVEGGYLFSICSNLPFQNLPA